MRDDVHDRLLGALDGKPPPEVLDTWIRPLRVLDARDNRLELSVPNKFFRQQIEQRYLEASRRRPRLWWARGPRLGLTIDRTAPMPAAGAPPAVVPPDLDPRYSFDTVRRGLAPTSSHRRRCPAPSPKPP